MSSLHRHSILAGRDKLCVNTRVLKKSKNPDAIAHHCQALLEASKVWPCTSALHISYSEHLRRVQQPLFAEFEKRGADSENRRCSTDADKAFDIEDIKTALNGHASGSVCPYYAATDVLYQLADVVFCPYSYVFVIGV